MHDTSIDSCAATEASMHVQCDMTRICGRSHSMYGQFSVFLSYFIDLAISMKSGETPHRGVIGWYSRDPKASSYRAGLSWLAALKAGYNTGMTWQPARVLRRLHIVELLRFRVLSLMTGNQINTMNALRRSSTKIQCLSRNSGRRQWYRPYLLVHLLLRSQREAYGARI